MTPFETPRAPPRLAEAIELLDPDGFSVRADWGRGGPR